MIYQLLTSSTIQMERGTREERREGQVLRMGFVSEYEEEEGKMVKRRSFYSEGNEEESERI